MPIELDVDDDDDEIGEALGKAHEKDLVDLAGILGMHNILSQTQYHNALLVNFLKLAFTDGLSHFNFYRFCFFAFLCFFFYCI